MKKIKQSILNLIKGYKLVVSVILLAIPMVSQAAVTLNFVQSDHLGTPRALSNSTGDTVWQLTQTPFGEATVNQDSDGDGNDVVANLRFPGQYYDQESEAGYNWHRHYDPTLGRYTQSDPRGINLDFSDPLRQITMQMGIGVPDYSYIAGINHNYGYVNGNPVIYVDPTGEFFLFGAAFGFVSDLTLQLALSGGDIACVDWRNVAIASAIGAISPILLSTTRTALRSSRAARELQRQLYSARTENRQQRLRRRIHQHNIGFTNALLTQLGWQTATYIAQQQTESNNRDCDCE